jgi:hypothetical protein
VHRSSVMAKLSNFCFAVEKPLQSHQ